MSDGYIKWPKGYPQYPINLLEPLREDKVGDVHLIFRRFYQALKLIPENIPDSNNTQSLSKDEMESMSNLLLMAINPVQRDSSSTYNRMLNIFPSRASSKMIGDTIAKKLDISPQSLSLLQASGIDNPITEYLKIATELLIMARKFKTEIDVAEELADQIQHFKEVMSCILRDPRETDFKRWVRETNARELKRLEEALEKLKMEIERKSHERISISEFLRMFIEAIKPHVQQLATEVVRICNEHTRIIKQTLNNYEAKHTGLTQQLLTFVPKQKSTKEPAKEQTLDEVIKNLFVDAIRIDPFDNMLPSTEIINDSHIEKYAEEFKNLENRKRFFNLMRTVLSDFEGNEKRTALAKARGLLFAWTKGDEDKAIQLAEKLMNTELNGVNLLSALTRDQVGIHNQFVMAAAPVIAEIISSLKTNEYSFPDSIEPETHLRDKLSESLKTCIQECEAMRDLNDEVMNGLLHPLVEQAIKKIKDTNFTLMGSYDFDNSPSTNFKPSTTHEPN